jgi:hypothetical protein
MHWCLYVKRVPPVHESKGKLGSHHAKTFLHAQHCTDMHEWPANIQSPKNRGSKKPGAKAPELQFRSQRNVGFLVSCRGDLVLLM